jgi:hypothetical protein
VVGAVVEVEERREEEIRERDRVGGEAGESLLSRVVVSPRTVPLVPGGITSRDKSSASMIAFALAIRCVAFSLGWYYQPGLKGRGYCGVSRPRR